MTQVKPKISNMLKVKIHIVSLLLWLIDEFSQLMIHLIQRSVVIARCIVMINFLTDAIKYTNAGDYHSICQKIVKKAEWVVD